jgi:IstB-like ATP binding protein
MTTTSTRPSMSDTPANAAITAAAYDLHLRAEAARLAEIAVRERQSHPVFLAEVLAAEVDERAERRRTRRIAAAKFPRIKRLAEFNVDAVPTISSAQLATLATGAYLVWSPATAVSTCSCSMSSATSRSTRAAPSCCSRSPPNARNAPPSASGQPAVQRVGTIFGDPRLVVAIVDRVTFNAHILETGTQSYRLATSKTRTRSNKTSKGD